jgi:hypothetical protein
VQRGHRRRPGTNYSARIPSPIPRRGTPALPARSVGATTARQQFFPAVVSEWCQKRQTRPPPRASIPCIWLTYAESKRVTDGARTRDLRSHNPMSSVPVLTRVSGNWAYLWGYWRFWGTGLSTVYRPVPARLQYGCSKRPSYCILQVGPKPTVLIEAGHGTRA